MSRRGTPPRVTQRRANFVTPADLWEAGLSFGEPSLGFSVLLGNSGPNGQVSKVLTGPSPVWQGLALPQPAGSASHPSPGTVQPVCLELPLSPLTTARCALLLVPELRSTGVR